MTPGYEGASFFVMREGRRFATPMLLVLLLVESTDVVFAVDSIPAIFSVTLDPFIIYTSNVFAILGLRSSTSFSRERFPSSAICAGLAMVLIFVGVKMLVAGFIKIPILISLGVIMSILALAIGASLLSEPKPSPQGRINLRATARRIFQRIECDCGSLPLGGQPWSSARPRGRAGRSGVRLESYLRGFVDIGVLGRRRLILEGIIRAIVSAAAFLARQRAAGNGSGRFQDIQCLVVVA